jgi:hypothetical protein
MSLSRAQGGAIVCLTSILFAEDDLLLLENLCRLFKICDRTRDNATILHKTAYVVQLQVDGHAKVECIGNRCS